MILRGRSTLDLAGPLGCKFAGPQLTFGSFDKGEAQECEPEAA